MERVLTITSQHPVVIFSLSSCCMCHTIKTLFYELGVNPVIHELDEDPNGKEMEKVLTRLLGRIPPVPVVFIDGTLVGSTDTIMTLHISGSLIPLLKGVGAIKIIE